MRPPLEEKVLDLTQRIVDAATAGDDAGAAETYAALKALCELNQGGELDHPLQWEALGDFAESHAESLEAYAKGLERASRLRLSEYRASIKLAMAEIHHAEGNIDEARSFVLGARSAAKGIDDDDLKAAIKELLAEIGKE
jgi:hypothetical protein